MNKKDYYIAPEICFTRLCAEYPLAAVSNQDYTTPELSDAKENNLEFEEDDTFTTPTQPNLWDDEEQ